MGMYVSGIVGWFGFPDIDCSGRGLQRSRSPRQKLLRSGASSKIGARPQYRTPKSPRKQLIPDLFEKRRPATVVSTLSRIFSRDSIGFRSRLTDSRLRGNSALRTRRMVRGGGEAPAERGGLRDPFCRRCHLVLPAQGGRGKGAEGFAEAVREVRFNPAPGEDAVD